MTTSGSLVYHFGGCEVNVAVNVINGGGDDLLVVVGRHFTFVRLFIFARRLLNEKGCPEREKQTKGLFQASPSVVPSFQSLFRGIFWVDCL